MLCQILASARFQLLFKGSIGNVSSKYSASGLLLINRARVKCCLLFNQTIECALFLFYFLVSGNKRRIRESDEKIAGCGIFGKKKRECGIRIPPPPLFLSPSRPCVIKYCEQRTVRQKRAKFRVIV